MNAILLTALCIVALGDCILIADVLFNYPKQKETDDGSQG